MFPNGIWKKKTSDVQGSSFHNLIAEGIKHFKYDVILARGMTKVRPSWVLKGLVIAGGI